MYGSEVHTPNFLFHQSAHGGTHDGNLEQHHRQGKSAVVPLQDFQFLNDIFRLGFDLVFLFAVAGNLVTVPFHLGIQKTQGLGAFALQERPQGQEKIPVQIEAVFLDAFGLEVSLLVGLFGGGDLHPGGITGSF
jgi:hypothetical protein